jgi:hypothetical protein
LIGLNRSDGQGFNRWRQPLTTLGNRWRQRKGRGVGLDSNGINCPGAPIPIREALQGVFANGQNAVVAWIPRASTPDAVFGDDTLFGLGEQLFFDECMELGAGLLDFGLGWLASRLLRFTGGDLESSDT